MISAAVDTDYVRGFAFGCRELGKRSISAILESVILGRGLCVPIQKHLGRVAASHCSMSQVCGLDGSHRSSLTDDYQFELRDQAELRRRRSRRAAE